MKETFLKAFLTVIAIVSSLVLLQKLLMPKYMTSFTMGALIGEYYTQDKDHDVLFVGDCEICTTFSPPFLWRKYGINSYVRGSVQQTIWQTYYLLEEMLEEEHPKVVVFNVTAMKYEETYRSSYTRMTLDGMKWSSFKAMAVKESLTKEESFVEYVFPLLFYHDRWKELLGEDWEWFFRRKNISYNGYLMYTGIKPCKYLQSDTEPEVESLSQRCYEYLDKMRILCDGHDIQLLLVKGPGIVPTWHFQWDHEIEDYAKKYNLTYINLANKAEEIGIDYTTDTFSEGRHMNITAAEKVSDYIGKILQEDFQILERREEKKLVDYWEKELIRYDEEKQVK